MSEDPLQGVLTNGRPIKDKDYTADKTLENSSHPLPLVVIQDKSNLIGEKSKITGESSKPVVGELKESKSDIPTNESDETPYQEYVPKRRKHVKRMDLRPHRTKPGFYAALAGKRMTKRL